MKRVYKTESLNDMYDKVKNIDEEFTINILFVGDDAATSRDIEVLKAIAYDIRWAGDLSLYKINREEFYKIANELTGGAADGLF